MENDNQKMTASQNEAPQTPSTEAHPVATGLGAVGGVVIGAALGHSIDKKLGTAIGGVVGAIAGGIAGNAVAEITEEIVDEVRPALGLGLGADNKPIELPKHYSWEELRALSKPNGGQVHSS